GAQPPTWTRLLKVRSPAISRWNSPPSSSWSSISRPPRRSASRSRRRCCCERIRLLNRRPFEDRSGLSSEPIRVPTLEALGITRDRVLLTAHHLGDTLPTPFRPSPIRLSGGPA